MKPANWIESIVRDAVVRVVGRAAGAGRSIATRHGGSVKPVGGWKPEELERRVLLSSAIIAFGAQQTFGVGEGPTAVSVADLNRDGKPDVVVANQGGDSVSVLLGNGDGTFGAQATYGVGGSPSGLVVADVNGDGKPDLVVSNSTGNVVDVFLGNGDGTFAGPATFATGHNPDAIAVADFNGDGKLDVAVANYGDNTVGILLGNGDGTFGVQGTVAVGNGPTALAAGDLNQDGRADLVSGDNGAANLTIMLGNGNGTFTSRGAEIDFAGHSVVIADTQLDGKPDVIYTARYSGQSYVNDRDGNGDGTLGSGFGTTPGRSIAVADVNVDARPDVVATSLTTNSVSVSSRFFDLTASFATGNKPYSVAVGELNGDGRPDLVVTNEGDNTVSVLLGDVPPTVASIQLGTPDDNVTGDGTVSYTVTFSKPVTGVDVTDFQPNLLYDVAATSLTVQSVSSTVYQVILGGVSGTGQAVLNINDNGHIVDMAGNPLQSGALDPIEATPQVGDIFAAPRDVAVGDINDDGKPDMVAGYAGFLGVFLGNGNGTFGEFTFATGSGSGQSVNVTLADVNSDGKLDVVISQTDNNSVAVLFGRGDGTFSAPQSFATGVSPEAVAVSDVNGDGRADLIVGNYLGSSISILLGNGNGTFMPSQTFGTGARPEDLIATDVNGDGKPDIVYVNLHGTIAVLMGNGDGTFQLQRTIAGYSNVTSVAVGDLNRDGKPDLIYTTAEAVVSVMLGNGDGTFRAGQTFDAGSGKGIAVADVNGDGRLDVLVLYDNVARPGWGLGVAPGNGDGTFGAVQTFGVIRANLDTEFITVADLNQDGRLDVVSPDGTNLDLFFGANNANVSGPFYQIMPNSDVIDATQNPRDQIQLTEEPDNAHVDWRHLNAVGDDILQGRMAIDDPNGLTVNGVAGDLINIATVTEDALPNIMHLNGTFYLYSSSQPQVSLAGTTLDIGQSTVYVGYFYAASDPIGRIRAALTAGYNNGAWNGTNSAPAGVITSASAAQNPSAFSIGYADSADGSGIDTMPNTIELKYTVAGDANLDGKVTLADFSALASNFGGQSGASWSQGDFTYDGAVTLADFSVLAANFGQMLPVVSPAMQAGAQLSPGSNEAAGNLSEPALTQANLASERTENVTSEAVGAAESLAAAAPAGTPAQSVGGSAGGDGGVGNSPDTIEMLGGRHRMRALKRLYRH